MNNNRELKDIQVHFDKYQPLQASELEGNNPYRSVWVKRHEQDTSSTSDIANINRNCVRSPEMKAKRKWGYIEVKILIKIDTKRV